MQLLFAGAKLQSMSLGGPLVPASWDGWHGLTRERARDIAAAVALVMALILQLPHITTLQLLLQQLLLLL
jgi:hypothetical protein